MFIFSNSLRRSCAAVPVLACVLVALPSLAVAQTNATAASISSGGTHAAPISFSLRAALEAAWALHPASRAAANRTAEWEARERAAQSWFFGAPTVGVAHRTDALNGDAGLREYEAEVAVPLWSPGVRSATQAQVKAEVSAWTWQQNTERLKLAGEVREAAAQVALARAERECT